MVEHITMNDRVAGSIPAFSANVPEGNRPNMERWIEVGILAA